MSAAVSRSCASLTSAHRQFEAALPAMDRTFRHLLRRTPRDRRAEMLSDARAAAWHAWHGLLRRGLDPLSIGVTGIAANAARYVKAGRRLGTGSCGRGAMDVLDGKAQRLGGFAVVGLDQDAWRGWLAADGRATPADQACFRVDFRDWLDRLPAQKRRVGELLAEGYGGAEVAGALGLTPGRVSQIRAELRKSWASFQGQAEGAGPRADVAMA